jgi:hypothetical protein
VAAIIAPVLLPMFAEGLGVEVIPLIVFFDVLIMAYTFCVFQRSRCRVQPIG